MKKLLFMTTALAVLVSCTAKPAAPVKKDISVQLYSIRSVIGNPKLYAENHEDAFKTLAQLGYTSVEAASYNDGKLYGVDPEQFKADVEAAGLKVLSSHVGKALSAEEIASGDFTPSLAWWDQCIAAHKAAGMEYIVTPGFPVPDNLKDLKTYCDYFNAVGAKCKEAGIQYGYHNHSHEFRKVEDQVVYDFMLENTDPDKVFFQMDVYWAVYGHAAPVDYFKKYPGRFKMLHIKDLRELGQSGMVGFDAIFNHADVGGLEALIVELEEFSTDDWKDCIGQCSKYLLDAPFVKATYRK